MRYAWLSVALCSGCFASGNPFGAGAFECSDAQEVPCDGGFQCIDNVCRKLCDPANESTDCGPTEACTGVCLPYVASCASDVDCATGWFCDGAACLKRGESGRVCDRDVACASGFCVNTICCSAALAVGSKELRAALSWLPRFAIAEANLRVIAAVTMTGGGGATEPPL